MANEQLQDILSGNIAPQITDIKLTNRPGSLTDSDVLTKSEIEALPQDETEAYKSAQYVNSFNIINSIIGEQVIGKSFYKGDASLIEYITYLGDKVAYMNFSGNQYDNSYKIDAIGYADQTIEDVSLGNFTQDSYTGAWADSVSNFTTELDATVTLNWDGTGIALRAYVDDRGGVWECVTDGGSPVTVSVWNAVTDTSGVYREIVQGLEPGNHTTICTFKGDDPDHVPSGGVGTARGWMYCQTDVAVTRQPFRTYQRDIVLNNQTEIAFALSNKEFAISFTDENKTQPQEWFPWHGTVGTAFNRSGETLEIFVDGQSVAVGSLPLYFTECTEIKYIQKLFGVNPAFGVTEGDAFFNYDATTTYKGITIGVDQKIDFLKVTKVEAFFPLMLPVDAAFLPTFHTVNDGYTVASGSGNTDLPDSVEVYNRAAIAQNDNDDFVVGAVIENDIDKVIPESTDTLWYINDNTTRPKLYNRSKQYTGSVEQIGQAVEWSDKFAIGLKNAGAYNNYQNKLDASKSNDGKHSQYNGVSGEFRTNDGQSVTVTNGVITAIV